MTYTYGNSDWGDLLMAYDGVAIEQDGIGNPTNDGTWTYTWKHGRQLATMSDGTTTWSYTYNADGLRTKRTNGTCTYEYVYLDGLLVKLTANDAGTEIVMYFSYDASGTPTSILYDGTTYYYVTNLQGDVVGIVNQNGNIRVSYTYDAWGNLLSTTGGRATTVGKYNPLRYRGYVYDRETGLYYLQSRYYDPEVGRFINADAFTSTGQGILGNNMFAYCLNNPVSLIDPYGLCGLGVSRRFSNEVSNCLFDGMGGAALVGCAIVVGITLGSMLADAFEETAEKIKAWVEAQATQEEPRDNSVYVLKDPDDGYLVKYVGRTNNPPRRQHEHHNDSVHFWRKNYEMTVLVTGLTKEQAMVWEQAIISSYSLRYLENARREIAIKNVGKYRNYLCAVTELITGLPADDIYELIMGR